LVKYPVSQNGDVGVPLGLLYLASYLRKKNPSTGVLFRPYRLEHRNGLERNLEADFSDVDIVGSGGSTTEIPDVLEMFRVAKLLGKITIAGGIFPTNNPEYLLRTGLVDYVVRGEGEETFSELVAAIESNSDVKHVKGISYLEDDTVVNTPKRETLDLAGLPPPAYDLAPMREYAKLATGSVYSARGCNNSCSFCTVTKHWQNFYRPRTIESVIEEMKALVDYGFSRVHFKDESMLQDRNRAVKLFTRIRDENLGVNIKGKARLDEIGDDLLELMKNAGVDMLHIGIESVSHQSLASMSKGLTVGDIRGTLENVLKHGIGVNPVYMFSWPGETRADLQRNAEFIADFGNNPNVVTYMSFITPHPGTMLKEKSPENGLVVLTDDINRYTHKQPVAVPASLGYDGLYLMASTYNKLSRRLMMQRVNPLISHEYINSLMVRSAA